MINEEEIFEDIGNILYPSVKPDIADLLAKEIHEYYKMYVLPDNECYCKNDTKKK